LPYGLELCGEIRGIREIRGYDQPVGGTPGCTAFSDSLNADTYASLALKPEGDRPSRTSGVGGLHEVIEHGATGFFIRPTIWPGWPPVGYGC